MAVAHHSTVVDKLDAVKTELTCLQSNTLRRNNDIPSMLVCLSTSLIVYETNGHEQSRTFGLFAVARS